MIAWIASFTFFLACCTTCFCHDPLPQSYLEKIEGTPDFCQGDQRFGKFPGDGDELCAPVALSNSLVWLNDHGFPRLLGKPSPAMSDQADLIRHLSNAEFLDTDLRNGTSPKHVISGIEKFLNSKKYDCKVEQMGWRSSLHRIGKIPDETWMLKSCMGPSSLLLNIGWYKLNGETNTRNSGHWITLVGFKEEDGHRILYVHDPGKAGGNEKKTEPCQLIPIPAHHLIAIEKTETIRGDGYFQLKGIHLRRGIDLAIIDGAVAFVPVEKGR